MIPLQAAEYETWKQYVYAHTGIHIDESKAYLIENRLAMLLTTEGCATYAELYARVQADRGTTLKRRVIDAITTNETLFFRDGSPFEALRQKILPDIAERRKRARRRDTDAIPIRIWSAACSTGQEVFSIAIALREVLGDLSKYNVRLVGTDISDSAIARASYGLYSKIETERGLTASMRDRYFIPHGQGWRISDELRAMATFQTLNLMDSFASLGRFDVVFCRNVAYYFREEDRAPLFRRIAQVLEPDGYLVLGSTETISNLCPEFESKRFNRAVLYQPKSRDGKAQLMTGR